MQSRSRDGSSIEKSTDRQPTKYVNVNENDVINEDQQELTEFIKIESVVQNLTNREKQRFS